MQRWQGLIYKGTLKALSEQLLFGLIKLFIFMCEFFCKCDLLISCVLESNNGEIHRKNLFEEQKEKGRFFPHF